jgi:hypothetical protein
VASQGYIADSSRGGEPGAVVRGVYFTDSSAGIRGAHRDRDRDRSSHKEKGHAEEKSHGSSGGASSQPELRIDPEDGEVRIAAAGSVSSDHARHTLHRLGCGDTQWIASRIVANVQ